MVTKRDQDEYRKRNGADGCFRAWCEAAGADTHVCHGLKGHAGACKCYCGAVAKGTLGSHPGFTPAPDERT